MSKCSQCDGDGSIIAIRTSPSPSFSGRITDTYVGMRTAFACPECGHRFFTLMKIWNGNTRNYTRDIVAGQRKCDEYFANKKRAVEKVPEITQSDRPAPF